MSDVGPENSFSSSMGFDSEITSTEESEGATDNEESDDDHINVIQPFMYEPVASGEDSDSDNASEDGSSDDSNVRLGNSDW